MGNTAREQLAELLGATASVGSFSARLLVPSDLLEVDVSGVGPVSLPVRAPMAKKLIAVARPAMFGRGEQTLTDTSVRDTWELTPDQLTLGGSGWPELMSHAVEHFRDELGLPRNTRLRAVPHSMLVYGKGQFFLSHQDSEKDDAMVGTLVVALPSAHTGGELVIDHAGEKVTHRASKHELTLVAFYTDCRHQVMPVRSGYRVTLTFDLLADGETATPAVVGPTTELAHCLTEHFTTRASSRYGGRDLGLPNRLVFLLDHEYTQRGLNWRRLKGVDAERAALVRAAAERAGFEAVLALAEVRETWDALPFGGDPWDDYEYDEDDEDFSGPSEEPDGLQLNELIDDDITLGWWSGSDGTSGEPISLHVPNHEVCATTRSADLVPYQSEYEGYMGNYGNTLDRWYRRAAVVVWPRDRAFAARAEAGPRWALRELRDRIDAGDLLDARAGAQSLAPFWDTVGAQQALLEPALSVAAGLGVAETAAILLGPFRVEMLGQEHGGGLAAVAGRYGEDWTRSIIDRWFGSHFGTDLTEWIDDRLPGLCRELGSSGRPETARLLAAGAWRWLRGLLHATTANPRSEVRRSRLVTLSSPLARLMAVAEPQLGDEITVSLRECGDTVLECLMPALRFADTRRLPGLDAVARDCTQRLGAIIARPLRDHDDWSIEWSGCGCGLCDTLGTFLASRSRRTFDWPLATAGRGHVHAHIDAAALPVRHQTRRQGRPYTLVLTKTDELFTHAAAARRAAVTDLEWLISARGGAG